MESDLLAKSLGRARASDSEEHSPPEVIGYQVLLDVDENKLRQIELSFFFYGIWKIIIIINIYCIL